MNQMELLQSQARTERELLGIQLTGVLEFRTGVLKIRDQRWDIGKGEVGLLDIVLNLIVMSVS